MDPEKKEAIRKKKSDAQRKRRKEQRELAAHEAEMTKARKLSE